jgi:hypothetical protein
MEVAIYNDLERRKKGKRAKMAALETGKKPVTEQEKAAVCRTDLRAGDEERTETQQLVKVRVERRCANPRLILCVYNDGGLERRVLVRVGRNSNFTPGMKLEALRPSKETEVWGYPGRLPRFKGRW